MRKVHTPSGGRKNGRNRTESGRKAKTYVPLLFFEKAGDNKGPSGLLPEIEHLRHTFSLSMIYCIYSLYFYFTSRKG